ncbi:MAG: hypothetical protein K9K67_02900 [Bacteriovoracaceae bacterium]|nr:hypothetical protein [Bacteriovoracaceae bacterium]
MEVLILGKCLMVEQNGHEYVYQIHYKGVLRSSQIKQVFLYANKEILEKGEEYLLHVFMCKLEGFIFYGNILRTKNIKYLKRDIF